MTETMLHNIDSGSDKMLL